MTAPPLPFFCAAYSKIFKSFQFIGTKYTFTFLCSNIIKIVFIETVLRKIYACQDQILVMKYNAGSGKSVQHDENFQILLGGCISLLKNLSQQMQPETQILESAIASTKPKTRVSALPPVAAKKYKQERLRRPNLKFIFLYFLCFLHFLFFCTFVKF